MADLEFGATLWGRTWLRTVERTDGPPRSQLPKARSLARNRRVELTLPDAGAADTETPNATAEVRDGSSTHTVTLTLPPWDDAERTTADTVLAGHRPDASGDLPDELLPQLTDAGAEVVPTAPGTPDETATCTCRARAKPCAHILATLYTLVSVIDERPLTALEIRSGGESPWAGDGDADPDVILLEDIDVATFFTAPTET